jgi:hypothetical protein
MGKIDELRDEIITSGIKFTDLLADDQWFVDCAGARVNKGAVLGSGMVLAQASVLSGKAEPRTVYAGVPARPLRTNVNWSRTPDYGDIPDEFAVSD